MKNNSPFFAFCAPNLHTRTHCVRKSYLIQHTASFRFSAFSSIVVSRSMIIWWLRFLSAIKVSSLRLLQIKERLKADVNFFLDVSRYYPYIPFRKATFHSRSSVACSIATTPTVAPHKIPLHYILLRCLGVLNQPAMFLHNRKKCSKFRVRSLLQSFILHSILVSHYLNFSALSFFSFFVLGNVLHLNQVQRTYF